LNGKLKGKTIKRVSIEKIMVGSNTQTAPKGTVAFVGFSIFRVIMVREGSIYEISYYP